MIHAWTRAAARRGFDFFLEGLGLANFPSVSFPSDIAAAAASFWLWVGCASSRKSSEIFTTLRLPSDFLDSAPAAD